MPSSKCFGKTRRRWIFLIRSIRSKYTEKRRSLTNCITTMPPVREIKIVDKRRVEEEELKEAEYCRLRWYADSRILK